MNETSTETRDLVLENLPGAALLLEVGTRSIVFANAMARELGATAGKTCHELCFQSPRPCAFCLGPEAWATGRPRQMEVEIGARRYDAHWIPLTADLFLHFLFDISERKRAEQALRTVVEELERVLDTAAVGLTHCSRDLVYQSANATYARLIGKPVDQIVGRPIVEVIGGPAFRAIQPYVERVLAGERTEFESEVSLACGRRFAEAVYTPVRDGSGAVTGWVASVSDITERKRLEAERTEALWRLTIVENQERQRISRDLHDQTAQRLVALAVELKNLEAGLAAGRPQDRRIRELRKAVDDLQHEVRHIAWDLRAEEQVDGDLEGALREYLENWSERVRVPVDYECRGLDAEVLPTLVKTKLYRIAREALMNVERHARARRVSVLVEGGKTLVRLTVEDDGCGFDPGASPPARKSGRRQGLVGMKERVELIGGTMIVESSPGAGTTILVRVPLAGPNVEISNTGRNADHASKSSPRP